jgi:hypothetical protein
MQIRMKLETMMARGMKLLLIGVRVGAYPVREARTIGGAAQGMVDTRLTPRPFLYIVTVITFLAHLRPDPRPCSRAVRMKGADSGRTQCHGNYRLCGVDAAVLPDDTATQSYFHNPGVTRFTPVTDIGSFTVILISRTVTNCRHSVCCSTRSV